MTTFYLENFGCRATQADAAAIERQLLDRGYSLSNGARADFIVVNTCTVTAAADSQARGAIRAIHGANPQARILVTGCYAQRAPEELAQIEGVTWVVGNSHKLEIPDLLNQTAGSHGRSIIGLDLGPGLAPPHVPAMTNAARLVSLGDISKDFMSLERGPAKIITGNIFEHTAVLVGPVLGGEAGHTRPILKIQDGCTNRCSYCVIPFVRGRSRSLPPEQVLDEICKLAMAGWKEIILSGINLGSYGRDLAPRVELGDVIRRVLDQTAIERLRLSSIEPMDVTQDLVDLVASTDRLARHFHVPLQSGSDHILAAMHRWYRAAHYERRIALIHERLPEAAIGADVIAGFPGESAADHRATVELIERLPFTYLHVFSFSERPGTKAAEMPNHLPRQLVSQRARELRALGAEKAARFRAAHDGRTVRVLTLRRTGDNWTEALSSNYLSVRVTGHWPPNQWLDVRLSNDELRLVGNLLT